MVVRDDDKYVSQKYCRNRLWLQRHPSAGLMVEARTTLLEKHRCATLLLQHVPVLWWIFAIRELFLPT